jgi:hypothetical protein
METGDKIYLVFWATSHGSHVENGAIPCKDIKTAKKELNKLYKQTLDNFSETVFDKDGNEIKSYTYDSTEKEDTYYYTSGKGYDVFERAEIEEASVK